MSLLGLPERRPILQNVYLMPSELYDPTDDRTHPLLVVSVDQATRTALVVTRTSRFEARGPTPVAHPPTPSLRLDRVGWWRVHVRHPVSWMAFSEPGVQVLGKIDESTWRRVMELLTKVQGMR